MMQHDKKRFPYGFILIFVCMTLAFSGWGYDQNERKIAQALPDRLASALDFDGEGESISYRLVRPQSIYFYLNIDKRSATLFFEGNSMYRSDMRLMGSSTWQVPGVLWVMQIDLATKKLYVREKNRRIPFSDISVENKSGRKGVVLKATLQNPGEIIMSLEVGKKVSAKLNFIGRTVLKFEGVNLEKNQKEGYRLKLRGNTERYIYMNLDKKSMFKTLFFLDDRGRMRGIFAYLEEIRKK